MTQTDEGMNGHTDGQTKPLKKMIGVEWVEMYLTFHKMPRKKRLKFAQKNTYSMKKSITDRWTDR